MSTQIETLAAEALSIPERAKSIVIKDNATYLEACDVLKAIKDLRANIAATFDPMRESAHAAWKETINQQKKVEAPLEEGEAAVKRGIANYLQEQERLRKEEELRLQQQAHEEAERQQLADAALLHDIGETDMANALLEEKPVVAPVVAPRTVPVVPGITLRQNWSAQVISLMELVKAVAAGRVPIQCLKADTVFLNNQARALKNALNYPGVRAVPDSNISARR